MMREQDKTKERLAIRVSIALTAGMFSIMPVACGAPSGGHVQSGGANITDTKNITSTTLNNVIEWNDFSVAAGETVTFDGGQKEIASGAHNYLNIVTGANTSQIAGSIKGGHDVYIVNPNGVIMGKDASVDVGNFYASTRYINPADVNVDPDTGDLRTVLSSTANSVAADVVNLGKINADTVVVEGQNIRFLDSANVSATGTQVTLKADTADGGYIHIGNSTGTNAPGYQSMALTADGTAADIDYYMLVNGSNWKTAINGNLSESGNYMLSDDIDAGTAANFSYVTGTFTGKFDGMFHEISNLSVSAAGNAGLFAATDGATIENLGVVNSNISSTQAATGAGAIVGSAANTVLRDVYNKNSTITAKTSVYAGGLVGAANTVTIDNSFSTGRVNGNGGGFIGVATAGANTIKNSYSAGSLGTVTHGFFGGVDDGAGISGAVENSYAVADDIGRGATGRNTFVINGDNTYKYFDDSKILSEELTGSAKTSATYNSNAQWQKDLSNRGGVVIDTATGVVTRPTWRIYEGQATPILTSMLKGVSTVNYSYDLAGQSGVNDGKDVTSGLTYAAADMTATNISYGGNGTGSLAEGDKAVHNAGTKALIYSDQSGYDIVGGTVTVDQKTISFSDGSFTITKEYDRDVDGTDAFQKAFSNGSVTASGIYAADSGNVNVDYSLMKAKYDDWNVGTNKNVALEGSVSMTGSASSNYKL